MRTSNTEFAPSTGRPIRSSRYVQRKSPSALRKLISFIITEYQPDRIILFGSWASKLQRDDSDIDLLIIKKTNRRFVERVVELTRLIHGKFGFAFPVEPIVITPDEFERLRLTNSLFFRAIQSGGIVLYEEE